MIAFFQYRTKAVELRLKLGTQVSDVRAIVRTLPDLLADAQLCHVTVLNRMPQGPPGEEVSPATASAIWMTAWASDLQAAKDLARELPDADETFRRWKHRDLETELLKVHDLERKAVGLRDKYEAAYDEDRKRLGSVGW